MTRYYFDHLDGQAIDDMLGQDLPNLQQACNAALKIFVDAVEKEGPKFWETGSYTVTVKGPTDTTLVRLDLLATVSPVARTEFHKAFGTTAPIDGVTGDAASVDHDQERNAGAESD